MKVSFADTVKNEIKSPLVLIGDTALLARITARAVAELDIKRGDAVWVQVKSVALAR